MMTQVERDGLAESVRFYAIKLAGQFYKKQHSMFDFDDVVQAAMLGACEAATKYDADHVSGANFLTFAAHPMKNRVITLFRTSTPVHIPRREYDSMPHSERGKWIWGARIHMSNVVFSGGSNGDEDLLVESTIADTETPSAFEALEESSRSQQLHEILQQLPAQDQWLVSVIFGLNGNSEVKVSEVAMVYRVTRQAVHQRLATVLKKLRRLAVSRGLSA